MFTEAADAFAEDVMPSEEDLAKRGGSWSGINQQLWSKYFGARAAIANIRLDRLHVQDLIRTASAMLEGTESGFVHPQVSRFRVLVRALAGLIGEEPGVSAERARALLLQESRWSGEEKDDALSLQFLTASAEALDEFKRDPAMAITKGRLTTALDALRRIPLIGSDVAEAVEPAIGARAVSEILGPVRTWIYRTLERLDGEDKLRKIILRLAQAALPLYAHIRHGPIEYGKDIVVFFERDGRRVLRMYQAKCGDVTIPTWREARDQLEEIFLVPLPNVQIRDQIDQRQGILVCNGHANPQVEPIMLGWFQEQKRVHNRDFEFMHLDALVNWIIDDRLVNEFKVALSELGIKVVAGDDL